MTPWPQIDPAWQDDDLIEALSIVQKVVALGRTAREASRIRVRQPLARLLVRVPDKTMLAQLKAHEDQVLDELNVKAIEFIEQDAQIVTYRVKPNLPRVGKRLGKQVPAVRALLTEIDGGEVASAQVAGKTISLEVDDQTIVLEPEDLLVETVAAAGFTSAESEGFLVALDTALTTALEIEGLARELVRTVQETRKSAGLEVSDRITLRISGSGMIDDAVEKYRDYIMAETLAVGWLENSGQPDAKSVSHQMDPHRWSITLKKID